MKYTVKPVLSGNAKRRPKLVFMTDHCFNAGQKNCRIFSTSIPFVIKMFVLSMFEWPLKTGFTVYTVIQL